MATIRKNALPDCQDFGGTRQSVAPSLWRPNLQIGRKTDAVARGLPAQRKGRGLALPHPALNQFLGQLLETPERGLRSTGGERCHVLQGLRNSLTTP